MDLRLFPRIRLARLPTPLEEMNGLRSALGCSSRLMIKRDDCTGLAFGGNKVRKLEYIMAEAVERRADTVITTGAPQSNHARLTAAFARKLGMTPVLVFDAHDPGQREGNLLLDVILGAELVFAGPDADIPKEMDYVAEMKRGQGHRPYVIPSGGSTPLGALGYANAMLELLDQSRQQGISVDHVFLAAGLAGTQAGLLLGAKIAGSSIAVHGISVKHSVSFLAGFASDVASGASDLLGLPYRVQPGEVRISDEYIGKGYGIPTEQCLEAITLTAQTEGIVLDPVYTGKAMAGLIDWIRAGRVHDGQTVVFWHTGGGPGLFVHGESFSG